MNTFKDVQQFHLGCKVIGYYDAVDGDTGKTVTIDLVKEFVGITEDGDVLLTGAVGVSRFKPLLKPLDKMSEADMLKWILLPYELFPGELKIVIHKPIRHNAPEVTYTFVDCPLEGTHKQSFFKMSPDQFQFLLSKHYDLWNLIPAGEAIDATTLEQNPYK